jgi:urea transport system ATP-binding protein
MLDLVGLDAGYGLGQVLWDVDLHVGEGEAVALLGRNGAGKTTLLRTIAGIHPAMRGKVLLDGQDITKLPAHRRARLGVSYVPQGRGIFPHLTVEENLLMGLAARGGRVHSSPGIPPLVYELFPVLRDMLDRKGGNLSGGQQQQLAIGRALTTEPRVLLLDEPTEGIQPSIVMEIEAALEEIRREIVDALTEIKRRGVTILLVEQRLDFAWRFGDRYYVMQKGALIEQGDTAAGSQEAVQALISV